MTAATGGDATAVYVAFRTPRLDLAWIPPDAPVVVVHNDRSLDPAASAHPRVDHVFNDDNVGFGGGVNRALQRVGTRRVVLCNPDAVLRRQHWDALVDGRDDELVTIPLLDRRGETTSLVNRYPTPASTVLTAYRTGRWAGRGSALRRVLLPLLGQWGRDHARSLDADRQAGTWPLASHWASAAVLSIDTARLRAVGGFDPRYFLYLEDVDLSRRLHERFPAMVVRVADVAPGHHAVAASSAGAVEQARVDRHYVDSARTWAAGQSGAAWRLAAAAVGARGRVLGRGP